MNIRVGFGIDVHQLVEGRPCIIGGVEIPSNIGPIGHSDADVLLHSISDALLGAANLRDIGFHFSDQDPAYKNIDSKILLEKVLKLLEEKKYSVGNLDCTIVAESPKMNPFIPQMQKVISEILKIDEDAVSIKATTHEKVDSFGRKEAIKAYCTCLIHK